jgi:hypothetical protein
MILENLNMSPATAKGPTFESENTYPAVALNVARECSRRRDCKLEPIMKRESLFQRVVPRNDAMAFWVRC